MSAYENEGFEIEREGEIVFSRPLERAILRDSRLSFGARGLFSFLWDLPVGWRVRLVHLASVAVGPQRRDAIRRLLRELVAVFALREEFLRRTESGQDPETRRQFKKGQIYGKKWVLRAPSLWAVEAPLSSLNPAPTKELSQNAISRSSANPTVGKPDAKGLQKKGFSSAFFGKKPKKAFQIRQSGIAVWSPKDGRAAKKIEAEHTSLALSIAVFAVLARGEDPLPGRVLRELRSFAAQEKNNGKTAALRKAIAETDPPPDPTAQAKGAALLAGIRAKKQNKEIQNAS